MSSSAASRVLQSPLTSPASPPVRQSYPSPVPEPDTTYRLPSVQTLLPVSTCGGGGGGPGGQHPHNNTDYGTLPADLFEPDSSERPSPASPMIMLTSVPHGWTRKIEIGKCRNKIPPTPTTPDIFTLKPFFRIWFLETFYNLNI